MTYHDNTVELFGVTLPIHGPVRRTYLTPFPPKMTTGDYSRDDQVLASTWVFSEVSGGLGIKNPSLPRDMDRYDFGTLDGRWRNQIVLLPRVHQADPEGPAQVMIDYNERLYYTIGVNIYRYHVHTGQRELMEHTLPSVATAIAVYYGRMFILTQDGMVAYDIHTDTWTDYPEVRGLGLIGWDQKLFYLDYENNVYWTVDPDDPHQHPDTEGAWEWGGQVPLPPGYCGHMILYHDMLDEPTIFVSTRIGLFAYDFDSYRFLLTSMSHPAIKRGGPTSSCGYGATVFRGEVYLPVGQDGYRFNHAVVEQYGPNRDEGLPEQLRGDLTRFIAGHAYLYAFLATTNVGEEVEDPPDDVFEEGSLMPLKVSQRTTDKFFSQSERYGAVLATTGSAWHVVHVDYQAGAGVGAGLVADIEGTRRLWFSSGSGLYWVQAPSALHNPLQSPFTEFQPDGFLDTFWYDAGWKELPKVAFGIEVTAENITDTEYIELYVAWDNNESWEHVGRVSRNGRSSFNLGQTEGRRFHSVKLRIEMVRGDDATKTPILKTGLLSFHRQPRKLYGWEFTVRLGGQDFHGLTTTDLYNQLNNIIDSDNAGEFTYKDPSGRVRRHRVMVSSMSSAEQTGMDDTSQFQVSVVQIDQQPYS